MTSSPSRVCPQCNAQTNERLCPVDNTFTVPNGKRTEGAAEPGHIGNLFAGRYQVESLLGQGGMGTVYKARQMPLGRAVALKVMKTRAEADSKQAQRFEQEARAIAAMTHPNVVKLIDFGAIDSQYLFLVMEFLQGTELTELIAREAPLPHERVRRIVLQILEVLAEAHSLGIVHRDLKPANVFLAEVAGKPDYVKVLDFGVAKVEAVDSQNPSLTEAGDQVGSPTYMSPEQCHGEPVSPRTDLYALGLIAHELLVGYPAFERGSRSAYIIAHATEAPRPMLVGGVPVTGPLADFVAKCLEKNPAHRPESAAAAMRMLDGALAHSIDGGSKRTEAPRTAQPDHSMTEDVPRGVMTARATTAVTEPITTARKRRWILPAVMALGAAAAAGAMLTMADSMPSPEAEGQAAVAQEPATSRGSSQGAIATPAPHDIDAATSQDKPTPVLATIPTKLPKEEGVAVGAAEPPSPGAKTSPDVGGETQTLPKNGLPGVEAMAAAAVSEVGELAKTVPAAEHPLEEKTAPKPTQAAVKTYRVRVEAKPEQASIKIGDRTLGTGVAEIEWAESEGSPLVSVSSKGYVSRTLKFGPGDDGQSRVVTLVAAKPRTKVTVEGANTSTNPDPDEDSGYTRF